MAAERARAVELIETAARRLAECGVESSRLDAQLLMAEAADVTRAEVIAGSRMLSAEQLARFDAMIERRMRREPIAYIVGHKEFYSLDFEVNRSVLIPRPETEILVGAALATIAKMRQARVLDIGTGSGAIAIANAANAPRATVLATDISADALAVATRNVVRHSVGDRVTLRRADCFEVLDGEQELGRFDLIVSNPPYVAEVDLARLEPEVRSYEPDIALSAGRDELNFYRRITAGARAHLTAEGQLIVEVGAGQADEVIRVLAEHAFEVVAVLDDFGGHRRVVHARLFHEE
ncbi:peptide chain release factor N(5)-glutamine methyltransferase [Candidatus Binatus sp.]|uniref:peptide chain release factor N(5)-glutamine methyltransferase n=1 Tax=Candidatus Binatus sp. TaxID=2811406 RepID=UPI00272C4347|nr:peptide chain release factor N(5)-glutamine methyltransferase [Candidatus Binatus sp.]